MEYRARYTSPSGVSYEGTVQWYRDGKLSLYLGNRDYMVLEDHEVEWIGDRPVDELPPLHLRQLTKEELLERVKFLQEIRKPQEKPKKAVSNRGKKKVKLAQDSLSTMTKQEKLELAKELGLLD